MSEFTARENIRRFRAQLLEEAEGIRKDTIRTLLEAEERCLRDLLTGNK